MHMCAYCVYSEIHCPREGTKPGDDSWFFREQVCNSNLDHNMNSLSDFSIIMTEKMKIQTCHCQEQN